MQKLEFTGTMVLIENKQKTNKNKKTNQEKELYLSSNRSNKTVDKSDNQQVEDFLKTQLDVIEEKWMARHAKFVYEFGYSEYLTLAEKARKYGRNPKALMGMFINKSFMANQTYRQTR